MDQAKFVCPGCERQLSEGEYGKTPQYIADTYFCSFCGTQFGRTRALRQGGVSSASAD